MQTGKPAPWKLLLLPAALSAALSCLAPSEAHAFRRGRPLTAEELGIAESAIAKVREQDPEMASELAHDLANGRIRAMKFERGYGLLNHPKAAALTDLTFHHTLFNPLYFSLRDIRIHFATRCSESGREMACILGEKLSPKRHPRTAGELHRILLGSMMLHERHHMRQSYRGMYLAGTPATQLFAGITRIATGGDDPLEIEAYSEQLGWLQSVRLGLVRDRLSLRKELRAMGTAPQRKREKLEDLEDLIRGTEASIDLFLFNMNNVQHDKRPPLFTSPEGWEN